MNPDMMKNRNIHLSALDCARLRDVLAAAKQFASTPSPMLTALERELDRAVIVPPDEMPPYVVTMNTCVRIVDMATKEALQCTLVYPGDADAHAGKYSILSDLGTAIIGYSAGDTIEWEFPEGLRRLRIDMIYFQPEATRRYDV